MATDVLFPFYEILVNSIFGSVGLAIVAIGILLAVILFLCRTSWVFLSTWLMFYFAIMGTMYIGSLGLVLFGFIVIVYAFIAFLRLVAGTWINI